jgi:hypothetical protein
MEIIRRSNLLSYSTNRTHETPSSLLNIRRVRRGHYTLANFGPPFWSFITVNVRNTLFISCKYRQEICLLDSLRHRLCYMRQDLKWVSLKRNVHARPYLEKIFTAQTQSPPVAESVHVSNFIYPWTVDDTNLMKKHLSFKMQLHEDKLVNWGQKLMWHTWRKC